LSGTTAGAFTSAKTLAPTHLVYVGIVTRAHPTQGTIEVKIQNGYELNEIHDVQISSPANKDILYHDTASSLWKHASIATVLGFTPYNATNPSNYIPLTALSASAPLSYNNTTGAFSITQANTSTNGFLSSTDWNTFNSKQSALTLGNVSEVSSNVLMFPDGGTGKTIGNLSIQMIQAGASTNGFLSSTDWTTFNNKQNAITGAATTITASDLTASRALISNASGKVDVSTVTSTELGYLSGVTSAIQTQLNAKQGTITNPVTGTGTTNYVTKWTSSSAIGNSLIFDNGTNVGIGTTTPQERFEVAGVNGNIRVYGRTGVGENQIASNVYWNGTSWVRDNSSFGAVAIQLDSTNSRLVFSTTSATSGYPTERMRITSTGNLGVGTVDPFSDSGYVSTYIGGSTGGQLILGNSTGGAANRFLLLQGDSSAASILAFGSRAMDFYTNSALRMKITSAGNVGIGTSSPLDKLTVIGNSSFQLSDANDIRLVINPTSSGIAISSTYNTNGSYQPLIFKTSDAERMRITSGGEMIVGATSMTYTNAQGYVAGFKSTSANQTFISIARGSQTLGSGGMLVGLDSSTAYVYVNENLPLTFTTNVAARMTITAGGNILMGTSTDNGERLYVSGAIRATGNITANSDLVLKKNLTLVDNPIDKLNQLNGYLYQWKENDEYQYGVIAQEVEKILPHAVQTGKNGIKGVAYNQLIPVMIEAIKELNKKLEAK
jgi:hypothetical protein